ncbi:MAG: GntR family transcriptional regulator [Deltaproteobacteria bacterium]|nr:GntR family transcriptional regulator [Deltaproteobacteria bacterium]
MNKNLRHKAYNEIKKSIIYFQIKPGQKIFEKDIAAKLKMSRTPVREALLILENEKLIEGSKKQGFSVRRLKPNDVREYFKIRRLLEDFSIPLVIENIKASEINALRKNTIEAEKALAKNNMDRFIKYESHFHHILYKSTKSDIFLETISYLTDKFHWLRAIGLYAEGGAQLSLDDHKKMLKAVELKDVNKFKHLMHEHLRRGEEKYLLVRSILW